MTSRAIHYIQTSSQECIITIAGEHHVVHGAATVKECIEMINQGHKVNNDFSWEIIESALLDLIR